MMYSNKEIKTSLRKYMESSGTGTIDEQAIIDILDEGADRDFDKASQKVKEIRQQFGVKRAIPDWLRMLTFRLIYDCMVSDKQVTSSDKKQETLLAALGFNKKVFDGTSWKMYSPEMKIRQSRFNPVDLPFTYAEVESNPIYVAMLHNIISESRVATNVFVDVFGKMGYVPAFCAEGYAHKLLFAENNKEFYQYYLGLTDKPTKAYKVLLIYQRWLAELQEKEKALPIKDDDFIENQFQGYVTAAYLCNLKELEKDEDFYEYAIVKFCNMCFNRPYWEGKNIYSEDCYVETNYGHKNIQRFLDISKEDFLTYAKALKKVQYVGISDEIVDEFAESIRGYERLDEYLRTKKYDNKPLLYLDAPKFGEFDKYKLGSFDYMDMIKALVNYDGDWILITKNYNQGDGSEVYTEKNVIDCMKDSERNIYMYQYLPADANKVRSIKIITSIDCDSFTQQYFKSRYGLKLKAGDQFKKQRLV